MKARTSDYAEFLLKQSVDIHTTIAKSNEPIRTFFIDISFFGPYYGFANSGQLIKISR